MSFSSLRDSKLGIRLKALIKVFTNTKNVTYDGKKNPIGRIRQDYFGVEGLLPDKENKILISIQEGIPDGMQSGGSTIRPRSYWEYDIKRNRKKLLMRGKIALGKHISLIGMGNATHASGYDIQPMSSQFGTGVLKARKIGEDVQRMKTASRRFSHGAPDPIADNHFLVLAHNGFDKAGSLVVRCRK